MKIHFKPDCPHYRARARRYSPIHQDFMHKHTADLEQNGFIYRNPGARSASASLVIDKKDSSVRGHRLCIDTKDVNSRSERIISPMPHIDIILNYLRHSSSYILLDAFKGYWQFPLDPESQERCSFMTHEAVFTPRRIIQGLADAVFAFQAGMQEVLGDLLYNGVLLWVDDLLGYAHNIDDYFIFSTSFLAFWLELASSPIRTGAIFSKTLSNGAAASYPRKTHLSILIWYRR
jgi:reverse transcriptase-like protein